MCGQISIYRHHKILLYHRPQYSILLVYANPHIYQYIYVCSCHVHGNCYLQYPQNGVYNCRRVLSLVVTSLIVNLF